MEIDTLKTSWGLIIKLKGNLDMYSSVELKDILEEKVKGKGFELVIDMQELLYMDSSGIGILIKTLNYCKKQDIRVSVANIRPTVEKILKVSGISSYFEIITNKDIENKMKPI